MTDDTLLFRQAHPNFIEAGELTSQAFTPFPRDDGHLSVDDGDQVNAEASFQRYTEEEKLQSAGVWAVTASEAEDIDTPAASSPVEGNPAHAHLDFTNIAIKKHRKFAKKLKIKAIQRGRLHPSAI